MEVAGKGLLPRRGDAKEGAKEVKRLTSFALELKKRKGFTNLFGSQFYELFLSRIS